MTNDPTDHAHLAEMAIRAKETLGVEELEVVADRGYYDGAEVKKCAERETRRARTDRTRPRRGRDRYYLKLNPGKTGVPSF